jgi:amino acid transporter
MAALVVLTLLGFFHVSQPVSTLFHAQSAGSSGTLRSVGLGLVAAQTATAIFSYNGYGAAVYFSEETRNAARHIARAIMWSLAITVAAELIPMTAVILGAPNLGKLISNPAPMQYFVTARGGSTLNTIVSLGIALAIINATVAITLQAGRTLYSSARDRAYPDRISKALGYVQPKLRTPLVATLVVGAAAAIVASIVPLTALITATGATLVALYLIVALSAIVGRRNGTTAHARYRMPAWPLAPVAVIVTLGYVTYELWQGNPWQVIIAAGALAVGYAYYYAYLYPQRATRWTMPDAPHDEHAVEEAGGILAGPALEIHPVGGNEAGL